MEKQNRTKHTSREKGKLGEEKTQPVWCLRNWPCNFQMNRIRNKKKSSSSWKFYNVRRQKKKKNPRRYISSSFSSSTHFYFISQRGEWEDDNHHHQNSPGKIPGREVFTLKTHTHTRAASVPALYVLRHIFQAERKKGRTAQWFTTLRFSIDAHHSLSAALRPFSYQFFSGDINQETYKKKKKK